MNHSQNSVIDSIRSSSTSNVQFCLNATVRMAMLLLVACFLLCFFNANSENILTLEEQSKLDAVHYTCALGTDVRYEHIVDALKKTYSDDEDLAKYFQCVFRLFGFVDKENKIKIAEMKTRIPSREKNKEYVEKAIDNCEHVDRPSQSKIAYEFFRCFRDSTNFVNYWNV